MALNQDSWQVSWQRTSQVWPFIMLCNSYLFQNVRIFHRSGVPFPSCLCCRVPPTLSLVGMHRSARRVKCYWKHKQSHGNYPQKAEKYGCNVIKLFAECWTRRWALQPKHKTSQLYKTQIHYSHFDAHKYSAGIPLPTWYCSLVWYGKLFLG